VARAIFASDFPGISAVRRESAVPGAAYAADVRAATPSNAAEIAVPHIDELRELLDSNGSRMAMVLKRQLAQYRVRLTDFRQKPVLESPVGYVSQRREALAHMRERLSGVSMKCMSGWREQYVGFAAKLDALSPLKVLGRGYSVVKSADGHVIAKAADVEIGQEISVTLSKGILHCKVEGRD